MGCDTVLRPGITRNMWCVCGSWGESCTYSLSVDRMHNEEERRDKGQTRVFKDAAFTRVHEKACHNTVQTHVDNMEIQRCHAPQQDVQPDRKKDRERNIQDLVWNTNCICDVADAQSSTHFEKRTLSKTITQQCTATDLLWESVKEITFYLYWLKWLCYNPEENHNPFSTVLWISNEKSMIAMREKIEYPTPNHTPLKTFQQLISQWGITARYAIFT